MELILKDVDYKNDFLIIERDKKDTYGEDQIEFVNLRAAKRVIQQNSDVFPAEALQNTRKWLEENF